MQNADLFNNMPASLAAKVQAYAEQTAQKAYNICKRYQVPQDVYEVFVLDAIDILRAQYTGLRATIEQMQILTAIVPLRSWGRTENAALCFMSKYYADIAGHFEGGSMSLGMGFINAVVDYEIVKRTGGSADAQALADIQSEAQRLYQTYAILVAAEWCGATQDELAHMFANGGITLTAEQKQRAITAGLNFQRQRQQKTARKPRTGHGSDVTADEMGGGLFEKPKTLPEVIPANKTIMQYQNFAYMQGNGVQTADNLPDGISGKTRPLWQGIEEQRQAALAIMEDVQATDVEKVRAAELVADTYAAAQVLDGIQILPQLIKPISGNTHYSGYVTTPREFYRIATGIDNPNNEQMLHFLRGLAWIDTQRISVAEITEKTITERDSSGVIIKGEDGKPKRKKVQHTIYTNFRPLNVVFRTEYEDKVPLQNATQLYLEIHNMVKDGRSGEYIEQGGKRLYVVKPVQQYLQIGQYYQFTTEEERTFRAIILSKPKQAEDTLLAAVFNYPKRQAEADKRAADAKIAADEMQRNPEATAEQKQQAQEAAEAAQSQARYYITNKMGRDYDKLAGMFEKAQNCGLITYYCRRAAAAGGIYKQNKYGRGYVWEWGRNDGGDTGRSKRNKE
jgi:hypothetical protein